ncbi:triacylglycerol lipase 2 isoform X2 [Arachis duranensis]|uniref:Triacylglycerol lipase 2 isoform X2 n=1 Tax=Arachis duranensis TaxID=130453 RepID=A0A6P5MCJ5_ARADU|nr:triacylglycerol lipase 2 isoform X2 [Arachis ipaensis]XP_020982974.1 triacylglycerol lipase 2 isoform X2 [Arachis duranensis]XP_025609031.1 triacylglycerol lipase 2 isoform X2 [Arachis hypogaea]XP_025666480.1 triacylglycerol lipase 2 isoform X2 [Arachis hypogaea]XP_057724346.1 triacylglycerol lipase 2-like isoform X2 [Arachis stenosperma]
MQRLRQRGSRMASLSAANLKRKALNSWAAVNDTFFLTKDAFERHRVVFTVGTSIASVATAWIGYSLRHFHDEKVEQRLESIEKAMKNKHNLEHSEIKDIVGPGGLSVPTCAATAATTLIIGYGLGWRGGSWYATKKFRKEQMKLLGQIKPRRWELLGKVTTVDGYVLSVPRIPVGRSRGPRGNRPPVLLQHGLFMDGITWLLLPPSQSLAFLLADNGFDVWIANTRGTKYSRQHISLPTNSSDYWNWSWDELVAYDLPATFQYVHDQTGQKLHYIGHSQGTLIALAALSKDQLLNMLRSAALLSPIAYVSQMTSPLAKNAADNFFAEYLYKLGIFEFSLRGDAVIQFLKDMCKKPGIDCTNLLTTFTGPNCCLSPSIVNIFLDHEPQSTATKNMIHLSQMIRQGTIAMFDYMNIDENTRHYGRPTPPVYDMTRIPNSLPLYLSYGGADALSDVKDVQRLLETLDDHDGDKLVVQYRNDYAHADYVMGENAKRDIYEPLISFFKLQ